MELQRNRRRIAGIVTFKRKTARPFDEGTQNLEFVTDSPITPTSSDTDILVTSSGSIPVNVYLVEHGTRATAFVRPDARQDLARQQVVLSRRRVLTLKPGGQGIVSH